MKHTPGEWVSSTMDMTKEDWMSLWSKDIKIVKRGMDVVAAVWHGECKTIKEEEKEQQANADLIAAAPKMLRSLITIRAFVSNIHNAQGLKADFWRENIATRNLIYKEIDEAIQSAGVK